jgi:hypothetical protein
LFRVFYFIIISAIFFSYGKNQIVVGVSEFVTDSGVFNKDATQITENIRTLVAKNKNYIYLDKNLMKEILKAQNLSENTACDRLACLVNIGVHISANTMVGGYFSRKNNTIQLEVLLVDVIKRKVINEIDKTITSSRNDFIKDSLPLIVTALLLPLSANQITLDQNQKDQLRPVNSSETKKAERSFWRSPYPLIGGSVLVVAGGIYYFLRTSSAKNSPSDIDQEISIIDVPTRRRPTQ